jgi:hypothetical protein
LVSVHSPIPEFAFLTSIVSLPVSRSPIRRPRRTVPPRRQPLAGRRGRPGVHRQAQPYLGRLRFPASSFSSVSTCSSESCATNTIRYESSLLNLIG